MTITDNRTSPGVTTQNFTVTGLPNTRTQANGVVATHTYDSLGRLTNLLHQRGSTLASYAYALAANGNRLSVTALNGRKSTYTYDNSHRLVSEVVSGDPISTNNGSLEYTLDPVGNRLQRTSTLAALPAVTHTYDANDRLTEDTYDTNGNTTASGGRTFAYDFENRLVSMNSGQVTYLYDADGARVAKTVGGVTTRYLVDDQNPTGYSQVLEEVIDASVRRVYTYGQMLISQSQLQGATWTPSYYGYDGHGSVTFLTDATGAVTDTYDYDAWGNVVASTGTTANEYRYDGQRWDADLGLYHLRARYYEPARGRFATVDPVAAFRNNPISANRYLYANSDPVNLADPLGLSSTTDMGTLFGVTIPLATKVVIGNAAKGVVVGSAVAVLATATQCNLRDGEDTVAAALGIPFVNLAPKCPEYVCDCECPVAGWYFDKTRNPKQKVTGRGEGGTKHTATLRCFQDAANAVTWADWNPDGYLEADLPFCQVTGCQLR